MSQWNTVSLTLSFFSLSVNKMIGKKRNFTSFQYRITAVAEYTPLNKLG